MRPYYAVVKDAFREAIRSPVLWILLALVTLMLLLLAPLGTKLEATTQLSQFEVANWEALAKRMHEQSRSLESSPSKRIWSLLDEPLQKRLAELKPPTGEDFNEHQKTLTDFRKNLNRLLERRDLYDEAAWRKVELGQEGIELRDQLSTLSSEKLGRFNRLLIDRAFSDLVNESPANSILLTYAGYVLNPEWFPPVNPELFKQGVRYVVNTFNNWFIGAFGVLVAILVTAPIVPRMFDPGQLHLLLSKPVSRSFLFVAQFLGGCAYIAIIVSYLIVGLWLILGLRLAMWETRLLWLIPIYIFTFALYYTVSALAAVITRNSIVAIVVSILFWALCWSMGTAKFELDRRAQISQFHRVVPAGEQLLAVNEHNSVFAWNSDQRSWKKVFVSKTQQELSRVSWLPLPPMPPLPGIVYDPQKQEILAVERLFNGPAVASLGLGRASQDWTYTPGLTPPMGTFAVLREPQGGTLFAGNLGLFRLQGDPTAPRQPVKVLGLELPITSGAAYVNVSPPEGLVLAGPAAAAIDPVSGNVAIYTRAVLRLLTPHEGKYQLASERTLDLPEMQPVALAIGGNRVMLGRSDGQLQVLDVQTLKDVSIHKPVASSRPRFVTPSPDGQRFAVVMHDETLWLYDVADDRWQRAGVSGQGDISTAMWSADGTFYVADRATRVSQYDGRTLAPLAKFAPKSSIMELSYRYVVTPLYYLLPKPGELYKTFDYLASDPKEAKEDKDTAGIATAAERPMLPVTSGLGFIACMLLLTCVYFERQEY